MSGAPRIAGIDIARGVAIYLMFQSHTVKGLLFFRDMPAWGIVPMHAVTKFSSSLFLIVFGVTLGAIFAPRTLDENWYKSRNHLWWRALLVLFWYKVLIVVQTFQTRPKDLIVDMLLYKKFPDFVEILDFYAWILLLVPLFLPWWRKLPIWVGPLLAVGIAIGGQVLASHWDFFGSPQLRAILVENKGDFCFGLLTRAPLAMLGIFIGDLLARDQIDLWSWSRNSSQHFDPLAIETREQRMRRRRYFVAAACIVAGVALLVFFYSLYADDMKKVMYNIARNRGKHPPELFFMSFSIGGALCILGAFLFIGRRGPWLLKPFEILGRESLTCFVWHILLIFIGYRWLFELKRIRGPKVSYEQSLGLTLLATVTAIAIAMLNTWRKQRKKQSAVLAQTPALDAASQPFQGALVATEPYVMPAAIVSIEQQGLHEANAALDLLHDTPRASQVPRGGSPRVASSAPRSYQPERVEARHPRKNEPAVNTSPTQRGSATPSSPRRRSAGSVANPSMQTSAPRGQLMQSAVSPPSASTTLQTASSAKVSPTQGRRSVSANTAALTRPVTDDEEAQRHAEIIEDLLK